MDLECLLCATLQSLLRKVDQSDAVKIAETVLPILLMILQSSSTQGGGVHEDAIQTVGVLVECRSVCPCSLVGHQPLSALCVYAFVCLYGSPFVISLTSSSAIGKDFASCMESFAPFLKLALKNVQEYQVQNLLLS